MNARSSAFLVALNAARATQGLGPLALTADLSGVASARASDMVANGYFAHVSPSGESWLTMLNARGVQLASGGENLARVSGGVDQSVAVAIESLMASPTHRANILNGSFTEAGIAALTDSEGTTTFVTIFGSR